MTLYLKYRSQRVAELDIRSVREMLGKVITAKEVPHAFLFCGTRGTGKTSAARILAKAVNCTSKTEDGEPCNKCDVCVSITTGTCPDVIEIDAASNRGIDEMRDLREKVRLSPMQATKKVYIIDEVHMLTLEAANALLKTLEEPPDDTIFILCTTDPQRLPDTVVSRCMVVRFPKPTLEEIVEKLELVVKSESLTIEKAELDVIAHSAKGSFRDAIKMLEQVAMSGQSANQVVGMSQSGEPDDLLANVTSGKTREALEMIRLLVEQGVEMRTFVEKCVEVVREKMLVSKSPLQEIALIEGLEQVYEQMKTTSVAQLPLEIWILKRSMLNDQIPSTKIQSNLNSQIPNPKIQTNYKNQEPNTKEIVTEKPEVKIVQVEDVVLGEGKVEEIEAKWPEIMKKIKLQNNSVEALLRSTKPVGWDGKRVELEVFYKFHKDKLESEKCRDLVEGVVGSVMNAPSVRLACILVDKKNTKPSDNIVGTVEQDIVAAAAEIFKAEVI